MALRNIVALLLNVRRRDPGIVASVALVCLHLASGCADQNSGTVRSAAVAAVPVEKTRSPEAPPSGTIPSFKGVGPEAGLDFERFDDISPQHRILEVNGGGAALFDFDRDGRLDVFFTNGCRLPLEPHDRDTPSELFRNAPAMEFSPVAGAARLMQYGYSHGCAVGDFDADGFDDLYVTQYGRNALWKNNGDGTFSDVTAETGTAVPQWSSSAAFADLNQDGHLDLYVVNYLDESDESPTLCPNPESPDGFVSCPPARFDGVDDVLFLSDGQGAFLDATSEAGLSGMRGNGLGVVVSDLNGDGRGEIYVANDGQVNFLLVPTSPLRAAAAESSPWEDRALTAGVALNEAGYAQASMGIAAGDYDNNGAFDLFLTHFFDDTNTLYANRGGLLFDDATRGSGLGTTSRRTLGFGTVFFDPDNDGWLDLFVANGHVDDREWAGLGEPYRMRPQLYRNARDGTFDEVTPWSGAYFEEEWLGRGVAMGDLDRDGDVDLAVSHQLAPSLVLENETETNHRSITIQLIGRRSNRNGFGARVEVHTSGAALVRELPGGGSFQSASALEVHVGVATAEDVQVRIVWPSGIVDHWSGAAGRIAAIEGIGFRRLSPESLSP